VLRQLSGIVSGGGQTPAALEVAETYASSVHGHHRQPQGLGRAVQRLGFHLWEAEAREARWVEEVLLLGVPTDV
jgi:hypothetical protein